MRCLVVLVEEISAKVLLETLLPKLVPPGTSIRVIAFEGKTDLEKEMVRKIRGWREPDTRFLVLRDQDSGDCRAIKSRLRDLCAQAGKPEALVRIACHELESWYLGDLQAIEESLGPKGIAKDSALAKYRDPDRLGNAAQELKALTRNAYQKVSGSRRIAPLLDLEGGNRSTSFRVFCEGVRKLSAI